MLFISTSVRPQSHTVAKLFLARLHAHGYGNNLLLTPEEKGYLINAFLLLQPNRFFHGNLAERVHGHLHVRRLYPLRCWLNADFHGVINNYMLSKRPSRVPLLTATSTFIGA